MLEDRERSDLRLIERELLRTDPAYLQALDAIARHLRHPQPGPGTVVVAVDDSIASLKAVHWAALHASDLGAELRLVHAFRWKAFPDQYCSAEPPDMTSEAAAHDVASTATDLVTAAAPGCNASTVVDTGSAGPTILKHAGDASLLVLGGSPMTGLRAALRLSTLAHVTARVACSVAVVPHRREQRRAEPSPVVVGVDAAPASITALRAAFTMARRKGLVVHVVSPDSAAADVEVVVSAVGQDFPGIPVELTTTRAVLLDTLACASYGAAAVVLARRGLDLSAPRRGRAARHLLNVAECPVLLTADA